MASTASTPSRWRGVNRVSAGSGPSRASPSARSAARVGVITSSSSRPRCPSSPAWGLSPHTAMRGAAMPNRRRRSPSRIRSTRVSPSAVMASATRRSGRWVVASATRSERPPAQPARSVCWAASVASIITTSSTPQASRRYSVWPVKPAWPASMITPLCSGAVTMPAAWPSRQARIATSRVSSTWSALARANTPGRDGVRRATGHTGSRPGVASGTASPGESSTSSTARPRAAARSASRPGSPTATGRAPATPSAASISESSGPMPAGSPQVSASTGAGAVISARRAGCR